MLAKTIKVTSAIHRKQQVLFLIFPYDSELISVCKKMGCLWSNANRSWYLPDSKAELKRIFESFKNIAWVNIEELELSRKRLEKRLSREVFKKRTLSKQAEEELKRFTNLLTARRYSSSTIETYTNCLRLFFSQFQERDLRRISNEDVNAFMHNVVRPANYSVVYQRQITGALKLFYNRLEDKTLVIEKLESPKRGRVLPKVLSIEEVKSIIEQCGNLKHKTMISLQYGCGLRIGELLALKPSDINSSRLTISIMRGKGKKDRRVTLSKALLVQLREYYIAYRPKYFLFEGPNHKMYTQSSVNQFLKRHARAAGISRHVSSHMLRHSYATHLMEKGVAIRYIQELLGHKDSKTTEIYTYVSTQELSKVPSPFDFLNLNEK